MSELNLNYLNARRLLLPAYDSIALALIGCGGTGSFLARGVATTARLLIDKFQKNVSVYFIDPDQVEEKNIFRQNFCAAEIGRNKAEALAFRYGLAWGLEIHAWDQAFDGSGRIDPGPGQGLTVLIGCVDNPAARKEIQKAVSSRSGEARSWWLDCGNGQASGQVLLGCGVSKPKNDPRELPGLCTWLPLPTKTKRHPELLEEGGSRSAPTGTAPTDGLSCADLAMLDSQGLAINQMVAAHAMDYLTRMLLTRDLQKQATYIDLASGSSRSVYIGEEAGDD